MSSLPYTKDEWKVINDTLDSNPEKYAFPKRVFGSALMCSFNIRKLGSTRNRSTETWQFLARICKQFDLIAVQEIMDDLSGLKRIMEYLGPEFGMVVSDKTGVFPGASGLGERLGFIYRWSVMERGEVISDISYDRTKVIEILAENYQEIQEVMQPYSEKYLEYKKGNRKKPKNIKLPAFLSFIRQPYLVSFKIKGFESTEPYQFMAVNAHLFFGDYMADRRQEFHAIMQWIIERVKNNDKAYYPNFVLLGDLNLDYDNPEKDRIKVEKSMKSYSKDGSEETNPKKQINVNFPFLDVHSGNNDVFKTNARLTETFDQIGLFFKGSDTNWPTYKDNINMGNNKTGPDYGVFNFVQLFHDALGVATPLDEMSTPQKDEFFGRFEHKVSDHMPLWMRLSLPVE